MSVAFRREGDDEHLEPKFEIPIPPGPNLVTARGLALIGERVASIEADIALTDDEARLTTLKRDLRYWQTRQVTAELMPAPSGGTVTFGTTVTFLLNGAKRTLTIVGEDEADPANGRIAFSAPLARALSGGEPGDILPFGGQETAIEIIVIDIDG